jgi:hypothetical protein
MINLDGLEMHVASTATSGGVGFDRRLRFFQRGERVVARCAGGAVARGWLVGTLEGSELVFRSAQREESGAIHRGRSICEVQRLSNGRARIIEHFKWSTRDGSGTNVFDERAD